MGVIGSSAGRGWREPPRWLRACALCWKVSRLGVGPTQSAKSGRVGPKKGMSVAGRRLLARFNNALADNLDTPTAIRVLRQAVRQREAEAARWMLGILAGTALLS